MVMKMQKTAALGYSVSFVYIVLPLSALIMIFHVIAQTFNLLGKSPEEH